jgi:hypothetical protein
MTPIVSSRHVVGDVPVAPNVPKTRRADRPAVFLDDEPRVPGSAEAVDVPREIRLELEGCGPRNTAAPAMGEPHDVT